MELDVKKKQDRVEPLEASETSGLGGRNKSLFLDKVRDSNDAIESGDYTRAIRLYTEAINLDPINHILYSNRSAAYVKMGEYKKGLQDAEKAKDLNPKWAKAYYRQGIALQCMEKHAEALGAFATGLSQDAKSSQLLQGMIDAAIKSPIKGTFEPIFHQLQHMKLDKSPFVIISVIGQELLATSLYAASLVVLEAALKIGTCSLKLRGSVFSALSSAQWALGDIDKAISYMQQDLAIAKSLGDQDGECRAHGNLGSAYFSKGNYREALTNHRFQLVLAMRLKERPVAALALSSLGHVYTAIGDYPNALASHKQCVLLVKQSNDRLREAREIGNVGAVYLALGDFDSATECHNEHLKIAKQLSNRIEEARAYSNLGSAHHYKRQYEKAIAYHNQVLSIALEVNDRTLEARAFAGLGHAARCSCDYAQAKKYHEKQLDNALQTKDKVAEGRACSNLGIIFQQFNEFDAALKLHKKHLNIAKQLSDRASQGRAYGNIGNAYSALGKYDQAVSYHKQELLISREVNDRHSEAATHGNLAVAYQALKMYEQSLQHYHTHLAIAQELKDTMSEARALSNIGNYHSSRGEFAQAIPFYQHFLTLSQELQDTEGEGRACHSLGYAHYSLGNFKEAIRYYEQDLSLAKEQKDQQAMGRAYCNLGLAHKALSNYDQALECQRHFLTVTHHLKNLQGKFKALGNIGDILIKIGNSDEAIKMYNQQLTMAKSASDKSLEASAYASLGNVHRNMAQYDKALGFHNQELTLRQELTDIKGECKAHGNLGNVHMSLGNYTNAMKCYEEQLDRSRDLADLTIEAQAFGNLGITKMNMGHLEDAIGLFEQQLAILEQVHGLGAITDKGRACGNLGDCFEALGDFDEAVRFHEMYLSIAQSISSSSDQDKAYRGLGSAHRSMGNLQQALVCYEKRLVVAHEIENSAARGSAYGELGCLHSLLGNFEQAVSCLQHQLRLAQEQGDRLGEADAACGLGGVYQQMGEYESALTYHQMDLKISEETSNTSCQCRAYGNLGLSHESLGNFEQAIMFQEQHLSIAAELNDRVAKTLAFSSLGRVHHALGHYPQAVQYLKQGLHIAEQLGRREDEAKIRHRLGLALWGHSDLEESQRQLYRSAELFESIRRESQISSDYKLSLFDLQTASYQALQRVLVSLGRNEEALVVAERGRTRAFVDLLLERQTGGEGQYGGMIDNTPMTLDQITHIVNRQMATVVYYSLAAGYLYSWVITPEAGIVKFHETCLNEVEPSSDTEDNQSIISVSTSCLLDQYVGHVRESLGVERQLSVSQPRLFSQSGTTSETESEAEDLFNQQLEEISGKLNAENDRTGFLRMVNRNHVFNASSYSLSSLFSFSGSINGLNASRSNSMRKSSRSWNSSRPALSALYDLLIAPLESVLPNQNDNQDPQSLVVVLQGDLYLVPFAVLRSSQTNKSLYERFHLVSAPSITALQSNQPAGRLMRLGLEATGALVVGNPELPSSVRDQWQWFDLPSAEQESKTVAEMLGVKPLIGSAATKEAVLRQMSQSEVLHFATHITWKLSSIVLSPGDYGTETKSQYDMNDSGSEISSSFDGPALPEFLLTAADILNTRLNCKLVVLSSGHTDDRVGRINSDGVVGLTRALLAAGAHAVLFSLWPIPPEASKIFLAAFYTALLQGCQACKALNEGMRAVQTNGKFTHPSNWGGWMLVGNDVKLSSKVALMGHALYELLQNPVKCREGMRVLLHLVEKSLQRLNRGQKTAMYTTQQSIENKVNNIAGWRDLLVSVGFRFEPAVDGMPAAVFFPVSDPGERLTQCSASVQALLGLPPASLNPLAKLVTQFEAGEAIILLLREVTSKFLSKEPNVKVSMRVKLWRVTGCHEFLSAIGFDLLDVGNDEVTIKTGKHCSKKILQFAIQALVAVIDTQEAPRSLSLDSSSSMESLASTQSSATSTSNFSNRSTPPDSPHGKRQYMTNGGHISTTDAQRLRLLTQGPLVGRSIQGMPLHGMGQMKSPVSSNGSISPYTSPRVDDAFRFGGPSGQTFGLPNAPTLASIELAARVISVDLLENNQHDETVSLSSSERSFRHHRRSSPIAGLRGRSPISTHRTSPLSPVGERGSNHTRPILHQRLSSTSSHSDTNDMPAVPYSIQSMVDQNLMYQSKYRVSPISGASNSTLTSKSTLTGFKRGNADLNLTRASTKSNSSEKTLTDEKPYKFKVHNTNSTTSTKDKTMSKKKPKRTGSDSSAEAASTTSYTSSEMSGPTSSKQSLDPNELALRVMTDTKDHWQAVEAMQQESVKIMQETRAKRHVESHSAPYRSDSEQPSTMQQSNEQPMSINQNSDSSVTFGASSYSRPVPAPRITTANRDSDSDDANYEIRATSFSNHQDDLLNTTDNSAGSITPKTISPRSSIPSPHSMVPQANIGHGLTPPGTPPPRYEPPPSYNRPSRANSSNDSGISQASSASLKQKYKPPVPNKPRPAVTHVNRSLGHGLGYGGPAPPTPQRTDSEQATNMEDATYNVRYAERRSVNRVPEDNTSNLDMNHVPRIHKSSGPIRNHAITNNTFSLPDYTQNRDYALDRDSNSGSSLSINSPSSTYNTRPNSAHSPRLIDRPGSTTSTSSQYSSASSTMTVINRFTDRPPFHNSPIDEHESSDDSQPVQPYPKPPPQFRAGYSNTPSTNNSYRYPTGYQPSQLSEDYEMELIAPTKHNSSYSDSDSVGTGSDNVNVLYPARTFAPRTVNGPGQMFYTDGNKKPPSKPKLLQSSQC